MGKVEVAFVDLVCVFNFSSVFSRFTGSLFSLFCAPMLTKRLGRRGTYVLCLSLFSVSMMMLPLTSSVSVIYLLCTVMGCGYTILGTIPNGLVTLYHYQPEVSQSSRRKRKRRYCRRLSKIRCVWLLQTSDTRTHFLAALHCIVPLIIQNSFMLRFVRGHIWMEPSPHLFADFLHGQAVG